MMEFIAEEKDLILKNNIQAFYFYAHWMPFHNKMLSMINKIEDKYNNIEFLAIDSDSFRPLCKRFNIISIPTVLIMINGQEKKRITGLVLTSAFKASFVDICS